MLGIVLRFELSWQDLIFEPISNLPPYMSSRNSTAAKPTKEPDAVKFKRFTPLLPEEVPVEGDPLSRVPQPFMEDWGFNDHCKYLQFE